MVQFINKNYWLNKINNLSFDPFVNKGLVVFCLFICFDSFSQWNPSATFYPSKEDCPVAMRICDATQEYNFELVGDGDIDDANGSLNLIVLPQTNFTQFESRNTWLKFTPQYSGQLAFVICPETPTERLQWQLWKNYDCTVLNVNNPGITNYDMTGVNITTWSSDLACSGVGEDYNPHNPGAQSPNFFYDLVPIEAGANYLILIQTKFIIEVGTHKLTLKFSGPVVIAHPDVFNHPSCTMSAESFSTISASVYPNPFTSNLQIESTTTFKTMVLYDVLGKEIINLPFNNSINTSKITQGVYLLHLITEDDEVLVKKVVKE